VPTLLAQMDVATAPYTADDGCYFSPLKLFEYMASGRAIATSRVGQVAEVITHGRNGMLCAPGDAVELAAVLGALAADPALRRRLGAAARADAIAHHTWDAVAGKILALAGLAEPTEVRVRHA
jgi:glycosyltransferase involved in cell wall biosynthesis